MNESARTMTSLEVSAVTGIDHEQVVEAIMEMEPAWERETGSKFQTILDSVYLLSRKESLFISARFNHEEKEMLTTYWND